MNRKCKDCGKSQPLTAYRKYSGTKTHRHRCKTCQAKRHNTWLSGKPEDERFTSRRAQYIFRQRARNAGLTVDELFAAEREAGGQCGVCGVTGKLVADHDHQTGSFRGMVCATCNSALGLLRDSPRLLQLAAQYLRVSIPNSGGPVTAKEIAEEAANLVSGDRQRTHGDKRTNFLNIAHHWNAYMKSRHDPMAPLTPVDVGNLMELMKIARRCLGVFNKDDFVDGAGYAACAGEIASLEAPDETTETTS